MRQGRGRLTFSWIGALLLAIYALGATVLWVTRDWDDSGPLSRTAPATVFAPPLVSEPAAKELCAFAVDAELQLVRAGVVDGRPLYACYELDSVETGTVFDAWVVDASGVEVRDDDLIKKSGAWRWIGGVKTTGDIVVGAVGLVGALAFWLLYYRRARPGPPANPTWWQRTRFLALMAAIPVIGWLVLWRLPGVSTNRKARAFFLASAGWAVFWSFAFFDPPADELSVFVYVMLAGAFVFGIAGGRTLVAPEGFDLPDGDPRLRPAPRRSAIQRAPLPSSPVETSGSAPEAPSIFEVERPEALPDFADVGGMQDLKAELRETIGLSLAFAGEAEAYKLTWNGILLHGRPGVGKTFIARATAGEFGLNFIHVSAGDLVSAYRGESGRNVDEAFEFAARHVPCILFFDEFDSIAQNREDWPDQEARRTVNQLLQSIVEYRVVREQIVMAATNHLDQLDPAVIRPGRFDRLIRVDLPDERARGAVFEACLRGRPVASDIDLADLGRRSAGMTPAAIDHVVELAAITALRRTARHGDLDKIRHDDLVDALGARGGEDRPAIEGWTWDDLVLPPDVLDELQQLQYLVEDPELARSLGVEPPTGVLLTGPPGTGKTSIARVLAAQAACSFYPVSAGDLTSMWLGESEKSIQRLFDRARDNRPSIIFIDEIDAIASKRGEWGSYDRQINELLVQIDGMSGQQGVLVLAASNRPDQLDPALLRGGRLSRSIEIPLPDHSGRLRLLELFTRKMPLRQVDLADVAARAEGASGADLRAICQQAALHALIRVRKAKRSPGHHVTGADFDEALTDSTESRHVNRPQES